MAARSPITCHVLDSSCGRPGRDVPVKLEMLNTAANNTWGGLATGLTDADGRTSDYWASVGVTAYFHPYVQIIFEVAPGAEKQHYHIPLLLSPFSYTTYRGS
ncbi:hypothetical protein BGX24_002303 [Mortierella sp. AD032]|nr:hypothetical protein BGX24_002303 [Mortierella sp. AD032]